MWSWINAIVDLVATYPTLALAVVFLAAIIEAVAVLGILIPGTPILMAVAGAAAMGGQPMLPFLALSVLGAVIGDFVSFWFRPALRHTVASLLAVRQPAGVDEYGGEVLRPLRRLQRGAMPVRAPCCGRPSRWSPEWPGCGSGVSCRLTLPRPSSGRLCTSIRRKWLDCHWNGFATAIGQSSAMWATVLLAACAAAWGVHRAVAIRLR